MEILFIVGVGLVVAFLVAAFRSGSRVVRDAAAYATEEGRYADDLIGQLFMAGVHQGFAVAWEKQLHFERLRRKEYRERLTAWFLKLSLLMSLMAITVVSVVYLGVELPINPYLYGPIAGGAFLLLALVFFMPRYLPKEMEGALAPEELDRLRADFDKAFERGGATHLHTLRASLSEAHQAQYRAGREEGHKQGHSEGYKRGVRETEKPAEQRGFERGLEEGRARAVEELEKQVARDNCERGKRDGQEQVRAEFAKASAPDNITLDESYQLLNCLPTSIDPDIRASYEHLRRAMDPVRLEQQGVAPSVVKHAANEVKRLDAAYIKVTAARRSGSPAS